MTPLWTRTWLSTSRKMLRFYLQMKRCHNSQNHNPNFHHLGSLRIKHEHSFEICALLHQQGCEFCIYGAVGFASAELWVLQQLIRDNIWICTHWSALKFQKYSLYHITGQGVSRANKCNSGFQRYCLSLVYIVAAMCSNVIVTEKRKLTGPQNVIRLS